jgi:Flp pilus assembly protein protease CpaA
MEIVFLSDVLLTSIAIIWLFVAVMQDIRKREVANWLNFSLLIIALAIRALAAIISSEAYYFLYGLAALAIFFVIANIFYYARIFAGGDAKLLIALAVAFATTPVFVSKSTNFYFAIFANLPFLANFLVNILFVGSVYGLAYSIIVASMHFRPFKAEFRKLNKKMKRTIILCLAIFIGLILISAIIKEIFLFALSLMFLFFPYLFIFAKSAENACMIKEIKPRDLTEGDWLFKPLRIGKKVIMPHWEGLSKKDIAFIKKSKIKSVKIKQGLPFVPVFLIALILSFFTNLLVFLLKFFV